MSKTHGFELIKARDIPEINASAKWYRHIRTGAELVSVETADENKAFCTTFKTPPDDDTGLPHILEHSVLAGSRKYPVKEPFVELLKTSVKTFLNAMTADDATLYPVASTNLQDFYNLVDVYLDAIFYPLITEDTLRQEGWHHEVIENGNEKKLAYKGVVFNEMKGYYSNPEVIMGNTISAALLPDTPYAFDAGGDPDAIPDLTYEQFKNFHSTYYHPSNARIFFYGDDDPTERLRLIDAFLAEFDAKDVHATVPLQPRFAAPRHITGHYDAGEADSSENKTLVSINWLLNEVTDTKALMALDMLSHILVETPASPLRKALIDSGLGEDIYGRGLNEYQREVGFSIGLKGVAADDAPKVETLVLETLGNLADNGIDKAAIESSMNTVEFQMRERNSGGFPQGLATLFQIFPVWVHGGDPLDAMAFEEDLNSIKTDLETNDEYFENLIGQYLIDNPHRVTVTLIPDPKVKEERAATEQARLDRERAAMSESALELVLEQAETLQKLQQTPDSPKALATLPVLTLNDLERKAKSIPLAAHKIAGSTVLYHDLPANGVVYMDVAMNIQTLPQKHLPYLRLFGRILTEMGTESQSFVELSQRIGAKTGGIRASHLNMMKKDRSSSINYMLLRAKAMANQTPEMLAILKDILLTANLDNQERLLQMAKEEKARQERFLGVRGQAAANSRLNAAFNDAGYVSEQINGISNLLFTRDLIERIESDWQSVRATLGEIRDLLINRDDLLVNVTADKDNWQALQSPLQDFIGELPASNSTTQTWQRDTYPEYEAFAVPTQVNFVGKGANLYDLGYEESGSQVTIFKYLNFDHLWNRIRVQGGAYGSRASFNHLSGVLTYLSWQDPNLVDTLQVYDESGAYLQKINLNKDEMEKAIIGAIGQMDTHMLSDQKGYQSMIRYLTGYTDDLRQKIRDEVFATSNEDFHKLGEALSKVAAEGRVVVTSWKEKLETVNTESNLQFDIKNIL